MGDRAAPPWGGGAGEHFRDLALRFRGRTRITQRELAAWLDVHVNSVQAWESGRRVPDADHLMTLIAVFLRIGALTPGREEAEATALWDAALFGGGRVRTPFDRSWFAGLLATTAEARQSGAAAAEDEVAGDEPRREDWGEAPDVADFRGRAGELVVLRRLLLEERVRVVALLGIGGIGKTMLAARLAQDVAPDFDRVYWRSLRNAPPPAEWLTGAIGFLAPERTVPEGEPDRLALLLGALRERRCLLVLDNFETVLQPSEQLGRYRDGFESYGALLSLVAEGRHRSCLVVTSREAPVELAPLVGERTPVRAIELAGLGVAESRALLADRGLIGDDRAWTALVEGCAGNGLALQLVGASIRQLFGGDIATFLDYAAMLGRVFSGVRQLLDQAVDRLSAPEWSLLRWLALAREPVALEELAALAGPTIEPTAVLEAIEALRRRSLLEPGDRAATFSPQSVVLEYVTERLVADAAREIATGLPNVLLSHALVMATAREYVRECQERLVAGPIIENLVGRLGNPTAVAGRLVELLAELRARPRAEHGYGPGNVVNLLRLLPGELRGVDLSRVAIRQAYLQGVEAQDASLAGAELTQSVLNEPFEFFGPIALSPDGAYLAAGTSIGDVRVWRTADRSAVLAVEGHSGAVMALAMDRHGQLLATAGLDGAVRLWDVATGRLVASIEGHAGGAWAVALSADGRVLASGGGDGPVRVWDPASGRLLASLPGHRGGVRAVALSGDGRLAASSGLDRATRLWDTQRRRRIAAQPRHPLAVFGTAISADGRLVVSGDLDGAIRLWEPAGDRPPATIAAHRGGAWSVALDAAGEVAASGGLDGMVRLWDTARARPVAALRGHRGGVRSVALDADGRLVASGGFGDAVRLWETQHGRLVAAIECGVCAVWTVAASAEGRLVAAGGFDGVLRLWDSATGRLVAALSEDPAEIWGTALSADGRLAATGGPDGVVRLWDTTDGLRLAVLPAHPGGVWAVALSADGRLLATTGMDGGVGLWDTVGLRELRRFRGHRGGARAIALNADGTLLASGGLDGKVRLWDAERARVLATFPGHEGGVWNAALSADGRLLATGGLGGPVRLWDTRSVQPTATLGGPAGGLWSVALSADGRLAATCGIDGAVRLWETDGRPIAAVEGRAGGARGIALSADGGLVASGGADGALRLWDGRPDSVVRVLRSDRPYERMDITGLTGVTAAQRGALIALGAEDRGVPVHS